MWKCLEWNVSERSLGLAFCQLVNCEWALKSWQNVQGLQANRHCVFKSTMLCRIRHSKLHRKTWHGNSVTTSLSCLYSKKRTFPTNRGTHAPGVNMPNFCGSLVLSDNATFWNLAS